jgi:hypothetical protein
MEEVDEKMKRQGSENKIIVQISLLLGITQRFLGQGIDTKTKIILSRG